jgi:cytochrome c oxidase subunit IV
MAHSAQTAPHEASHPSRWGYVKIFLILFALTAIEVGLLYVPAVKPALPYLLIGLSAAKFSLVAAFYMHLRFDNWLFTAFFVGGLALAASLLLALATLFGTWWQEPIVHGNPNVEHGTARPEGH